MRILLTAINAKYIHSNLAVYSLKGSAGKYEPMTELAEDTINQQLEEVVPQNQFHCSHLDDDTHQEAQQHHMSAGKYRVIDEILRHDSAKSVEELQKLSMKELYSVLERYDPSAVPEGCHGRQMRKGHHHGS